MLKSAVDSFVGKLVFVLYFYFHASFQALSKKCINILWNNSQGNHVMAAWLLFAQKEAEKYERTFDGRWHLHLCYGIVSRCVPQPLCYNDRSSFVLIGTESSQP